MKSINTVSGSAVAFMVCAYLLMCVAVGALFMRVGVAADVRALYTLCIFGSTFAAVVLGMTAMLTQATHERARALHMRMR